MNSVEWLVVRSTEEPLLKSTVHYALTTKHLEKSETLNVNV